MATLITDENERARILAELAEQQQGENPAAGITEVLESGPGRFAGGFAKPFLEVGATLDPDIMTPELRARLDRPGGLPKTLGSVAGNIALSAAPASGAYRLTRAATTARPFLNRVAPLTAESAAVGGVEAAKAPGEGESRLQRARQAALFNLGGGAAMAGLSRAVRPQMFRTKDLVAQEEAFLRGQGIEPELPLVLRAEGTGPTSNMLEYLHGEPMRSLPWLGPKLQQQTARALDDWREAILSTAVPQGARGQVPMPRNFEDAQAPIRETLGAIQRWYGRQYAEVLEPYAFNLQTPQFQQAIGQAVADIPSVSARKKVMKNVLKTFRDYQDQYGAVSGDNISGIKRALYDRIRDKKATGDIKEGYFGVLRALDDAVTRRIAEVNPIHARRYSELAEPYRNLTVIEEASTRSRSELGEFQPKDLAAATVAKAKREAGGPKRAARGAAPLQDEAERAVRLYDQAVRFREQRLFKFLAMGGSIAGVAGGYAAPTAGIWAGLASTVPPGAQRYLMGTQPAQQWFGRLSRTRAAEEAARAARIGAGAYGRE